jgi:predicted transcriptional regulator
MPARNNEKAQQIRELKAQGLNQSEIAAELGCTQAAISRMCQTHKITWEIGAAARDQRGEKNPNFQGGLAKSTIERLTRRIVTASGQSLFVCEHCGEINKYQEHPRHHKDRDRSNNDASNIEVLCIACHNVEHNKERIRDSVTGRFLT